MRELLGFETGRRTTPSLSHLTANFSLSLIIPLIVYGPKGFCVMNKGYYYSFVRLNLIVMRCNNPGALMR